MFDKDKNWSLYLLLPLIAKYGETWTNYMHIQEKAFLNAFSNDINRPWIDKHILLLYETEKLTVLKIKELISNENYSVHYTFNVFGKYVDMYALEIPRANFDTYKLIMSNKVTDISSTWKVRILNFWGCGHDTPLFEVLFRNNITIDMESEQVPEETTVSILGAIINASK